MVMCQNVLPSKTKEFFFAKGLYPRFYFCSVLLSFIQVETGNFAKSHTVQQLRRAEKLDLVC